MALKSVGRIRRSHLYWHVVFFGLICVLLFLIMRGLGQVLTPVAAALVLSYLLDPLVTFMERRWRIARWLGSLILFLVAIVLFTALVLLLLPQVVQEVHAFSEALPRYIAQIRDALVPWIERNFELTIPKSLSEMATQFGADLRGLASKVVAPLGTMAGAVMKEIRSFLTAVVTLFLIPVFTFFFLPKLPGILKGGQELIPRRYLPWVRETATEIDRAVSAWIRGQVTVVCVLALLYAAGLSIVGIKMAVLIGLLTGLLAFIPYAGVAIGMTFSLLVCILEYSGPGQIVGVALVFGVVQSMDGLFLTPYIVGERVGIGPVGVIIALMIGGTLFGFSGILLAVPTAAAAVVILKRWIAAYKDSRFYQKGAELTPVTEEIAEEH